MARDGGTVGGGGLASERTALAWRRSGLSLVVVGLAIARGIPTRDGVPGRPLIGVVVLVLGGLLFLVSTGAASRRARHIERRPAATLGDLAPMAIASAVVAATAFLVVLLSP